MRKTRKLAVFHGKWQQIITVSGGIVLNCCALKNWNKMISHLHIESDCEFPGFTVALCWPLACLPLDS